MKSLSAAWMTTAGLASLTVAPWLIRGDTSVFVMIVALVVTASGLIGWIGTMREPRRPDT